MEVGYKETTLSYAGIAPAIVMKAETAVMIAAGLLTGGVVIYALATLRPAQVVVQQQQQPSYIPVYYYVYSSSGRRYSRHHSYHH